MADCFLMERWKERICSGDFSSAWTFLHKLTAHGTPESTKSFILDNMHNWQVITATWFEMARHIDKLEELARDTGFTGQYKAALLCSKIHYCLEQYEQALDYALISADEFKLTPSKDDFKGHDSLYLNKIIRQALNTHKLAQIEHRTSNNGLDVLINRIFQQNMELRDYSCVIRYALDSRRIDMIERAIEAASSEENDSNAILIDTLEMLYGSQMDIQFQHQVLDLVHRLLGNQREPNYLAVSQCLVKLGQFQTMAEILKQLLQKNKLMAFQLAFDLNENAPQEFLKQLEHYLFPQDANSEDNQELCTNFESLRRILNGEETIKHHMQFLIKNNHTDMLILKQLKDSSRGACTHNAVVISNGLMHTGTTCDDFLRENLEWISKATNWNKFNAVASLGLIHKGHEHDAKKLLDPYLPKGDQDQYGYKEGGSLYAYGLIHANHGSAPVIQYLLDQLNKASTVAVRHGACLGLGLAALGSRDMKVYEHLREVLYHNEAVSGEAAGTAMGLVMAGSMNEEIFNEMYQYILETQHDKIQRGCRTGIAMLAYGGMERSENLIKKLESNSSEAILRQTAVCMMAMAYAGTGNPIVIEKLLCKYVASDPNNDVKRLATIALGFILSSEPQQCFDYVELLTQHFDGHIRYGAAMALGISCAGTGYKEAIALLQPLLQAKENYVRQGALIALSFVLIQQTHQTCDNVTEFRKTLTKMINEKGEDMITKFGAIIAQGILDAGGRNVTLSLHNRNGQPDMPSTLGIFVFLQHFYWHSMTHFISLAFHPTCLIALNSNLKMPKMEFRCNAKPSLFSYPPPLEEKRKEAQEKVETAVLSITNKKAALSDKKKNEPTETSEKMEVDESKETKATDQDKKDTEEKQNEKQKELTEPTSCNLSNPTRVVRLQLRALAMPDNSPYQPMKPITQGGIVMVKKVDPEKPEEIVELAVAGGTITEESKDSEPIKPHEPFEFTLGAY